MTKIKKPELLPPAALKSNQSIVPTLSANYERLIGCAIVSWSRLEDAIQDTLWTLLGTSMEEGRIVTSRLDAKYRTNMLEGLGKKHLSGKEAEYFLGVISSIRNLYEERNIIAHGTWGTLEPDDVPVVASLRFKLLDEFGSEDVMSQHFPEERFLDFLRGAQEMIEAVVHLREVISSRGKST